MRKSKPPTKSRPCSNARKRNSPTLSRRSRPMPSRRAPNNFSNSPKPHSHRKAKKPAANSKNARSPSRAWSSQSPTPSGNSNPASAKSKKPAKEPIRTCSHKSATSTTATKSSKAKPPRSSKRYANPPAAVNGAKSNSAAWSNSPACRNTAISKPNTQQPPTKARNSDPTSSCTCPAARRSWSIRKPRWRPTSMRFKRPTIRHAMKLCAATQPKCACTSSNSRRKITPINSLTRRSSPCFSFLANPSSRPHSKTTPASSNTAWKKA